MWAEFIAIWRKLRGWIRQEDEEVNKEESARLVISKPFNLKKHEMYVEDGVLKYRDEPSSSSSEDSSESSSEPRALV